MNDESNGSKKLRPRTPETMIQGIAREQRRIGAMAKRARIWKLENPRRWLEDALASLQNATDDLRQLPPEWVPPTAPKARGQGSASLDTGATVEVKEKERARYDGLFPEGSLLMLKVERRVKGAVVCRTPEGERVVLPVSHVHVVQAAP